MKKYLSFLLIAIFAAGCCPMPKEKKETLAKINNYEISRAEFEQEFLSSSFARADTLESRKEFLENLINRKLILQDAQKTGLDKAKSFLKMIERFWEQSLLKLTLDVKTKEIAGAAFVSDKEIEEAYNKLQKEGKADKAYEQMYKQLKWEITRSKESQAMAEWVARLRRQADIKVNEQLLK